MVRMYSEDINMAAYQKYVWAHDVGLHEVRAHTSLLRCSTVTQEIRDR